MSKDTKNYLHNRIMEIETELSKNGVVSALINEKNSHLEVLKMISFIEENEIDITNRVVTLPSLEGHGYYGYRLMIDNEVDDPSKWTLLEEIDGTQAEFILGDKILTK